MPSLLLSRLRSSKLGRRLKRKDSESKGEEKLGAEYVPLKEVPFSRLQEGPAFNLALQGWAELDFIQDEAGHVNDQLLEALQALVEAGKTFFAQPRESKEAYYQTQGDGEEGGWSRVEGEKEMFTIRQDSPQHLPPEIRSAARSAWVAASSYTNSLLGSVAQTLDLPPEALTQYSEPGLEMTETRQATMMRLFRYECQNEKVVSEQHTDLGLLSLVYGEQPGLEVWDRYTQSFFPIELTFQPGKKATVMAGNTLAKLTNWRYIPGGHRVVSYPRQGAETPYRYSLVFIQRAHWPVPVDTDKLTTAITGTFKEPFRDAKARDVFKTIYDGKYSVNASAEKRAQQKAALQERSRSSFTQAVTTDQVQGQANVPARTS